MVHSARSGYPGRVTAAHSDYLLIQLPGGQFRRAVDRLGLSEKYCYAECAADEGDTSGYSLRELLTARR